MSRQIGSFHHSISHPANLYNAIPIIPLFAFPPLESHHINTSSGMDSDANSDNTVFNTISQFNNSDIGNPDEFANCEPSPSTFSSILYRRPIHSQSQNDSPSTSSRINQVTTTFPPFTNERSNNNSRETTQISSELNNLMTLQQQIQHPHTLTIHQL